MKKRSLSLFILLSVLAAFAFSACQATLEDEAWKSARYTEDTEFGTGEKTVTVKVVCGENSVNLTIHTDKETLADALIEHELVEGDEGAYGLYVKVVNGVKADYDTDMAYWMLNKYGKMADNGVSQENISGGESYELVYTKG